MQFINLAGQRFNRLIVLKLSEKRQLRGTNGGKIGTVIQWICQCDCGSTTEVTTDHLRSGHTQSCGCYRNSLIGQRSIIHGKTGTPEHRIWKGMLNRCYNKGHSSYRYYGGRGILVSPVWRHDFEKFLIDMGLRPSPRHTIERIDVNGHYSPENCHWELPVVQTKNRRLRALETFSDIELINECKRRGLLSL